MKINVSGLKVVASFVDGSEKKSTKNLNIDLAVESTVVEYEQGEFAAELKSQETIVLGIVEKAVTTFATIFEKHETQRHAERMAEVANNGRKGAKAPVSQN